MTDFLVRGDLATVDPAIAELIQHEHARQFAKLIMIASESSAPAAVLEAEGSVLQNLYAEGYPHPDAHGLAQEQLLNYDEQLAYFRRYADRRYYKGVEYCNVVESLARRRGAELFCPPGLTPDQVYLNVQPLSGAVANTAVYEALVNEGDTVMGLDLLHGGHLSHGSPVNHSGRHHRIVFYRVSEKTELLDYDAIYDTAMREKPRMIIAGYTSYPWAPDFRKFREIADAVGAYLLADISHVVGLALAGVYPNPVGVAHVTTFTTHKTLMGPRGAVIVSTDEEIARKIDRAVFPGEQGGPHMNKIAAIAVAFKLAQRPEFKQVQQQIVANAVALSDGFKANGLRVVHDGTNTHMAVLDCKSIANYKGERLMGDAAARILDLANIVCNRNTIPGDRDATRPSGLRFGTPWVTQRGLKEADMREIADVIALILKTAKPYTYVSPHATAYRAKVEFDALVSGAQRISALAQGAGADAAAPKDGYPHVWTSLDGVAQRTVNGLVALDISGDHTHGFLQDSVTSDVSRLAVEDTQQAWLLEPDGAPMSPAVLLNAGNAYRLAVPADKATRVAQWLRALSDGYVIFDQQDIHAKLPGPVIVKVADANGFDTQMLPSNFDAAATANGKPYFIGRSALPEQNVQPEPMAAMQSLLAAQAPETGLKRTTLYETHKQLGAKLAPFAGWEMPVWYGGSSVSEEHQAVRKAAGLFDVSHMGVLEASGPNAREFLDAVSTNDVNDIPIGGSAYAYMLDTNGDVIDDIMIYRVEKDNYLVVVNAANNDKDWAWLTAINAAGQYGLPQCRLRDLRDPSSGADIRVDLALQGPASLATLLQLTDDPALRHRLSQLPHTGVTRGALAGIDIFISRTGYTGESLGFELFVHPDHSVELWNAILEAGKSQGVKPAGLGARDSTRTEAGLPLYGHELAGPLNLLPGQVGFAGYVKSHKPFFIGKNAYYQKAAKSTVKLSRFRMSEKGVRMPKLGDPVLDSRGRVIGTVTSCALDTEGYLLGMAVIDLTVGAKDGAQIFILAIPERMPAPLTSLAPLGSKAMVADSATVLTRFPKRK
ncbi:MAG: glycine cleavage system aminomethyltransferase GcvT [Chloroflexi bacterium]|nr:glycine cleavage system aminomethyltransferase GcvT [Chloroflexota bacterium]MCL5274057.1 glycine cleavage system aminomethyltransferase GcvT [Chloroflexota bacterium]